MLANNIGGPSSQGTKITVRLLHVFNGDALLSLSNFVRLWGASRSIITVHTSGLHNIAIAITSSRLYSYSIIDMGILSSVFRGVNKSSHHDKSSIPYENVHSPAQARTPFGIGVVISGATDVFLAVVAVLFLTFAALVYTHRGQSASTSTNSALLEAAIYVSRRLRWCWVRKFQ